MKASQNLKYEQNNMLRQLVETESWQRLPLPKDFEIKELINPFTEFPHRFEKYMSAFSS
jgi:hypothetical protein